MDRHLVRWKVIGEEKLRHKDDPTIPDIIDNACRRTLIYRILSMEIKAAISLDKAIRLADKASRAAADEGRLGTDPGETFWYWSHFVEWISSQGYHIELTGDEFDPIAATPIRDC